MKINQNDSDFNVVKTWSKADLKQCERRPELLVHFQQSKMKSYLDEPFKEETHGVIKEDAS